MTGIKISFSNNAREYQNLKEELLHTYDSVMTSGRLMDGANIALLEEKMKGITNRKYAVATNSCTSALQFLSEQLSLFNASIFGIKPSDPRRTIYYPLFSYIATLNTIDHHGLTDKEFVDVDDNGLLRIEDINASNMRCVFGVNLYGLIPDYDKLQTSMFFSPDNNLPYILFEDAAQSLFSKFKGRPSGSFGNASCLSFDSSKILGASTGGMLLTDNEYLASYFRSYISNGAPVMSIYKHRHDQSLKENGIYQKWEGYKYKNLRMTELDAATLLVKLNHISKNIARRNKIAEYYFKNIQRFRMLSIPEETEWNASRFPLFAHNSIDQVGLERCLINNGIETKRHYDYHLGCTTYIINNDLKETIDKSKAKDLSTLELTIPLYPELTDSEVEHIVETINSYHVDRNKGFLATATQRLYATVRDLL